MCDNRKSCLYLLKCREENTGKIDKRMPVIFSDVLLYKKCLANSITFDFTRHYRFTN